MHLQNEWLTLRENDYELPNGKRLTSYWLVEKPEYVLVIGRTSMGSLILIREFRPGNGEVLLSFPAGIIDPGEDPATAAVREFREETGWEASAPRYLGVLKPQPGWLHTSCHIYLVDACQPPAPLPVDAEIESVEVHPWDDVRRMVRDGSIREMHSVAGFYLALDLSDV